MLTTPLVIAPKVTVLNFGQITDPTNSNFYKITKQGGTSTMTFFPVGYTISRSIPSYKTMTINDDDNKNNTEKDEDLPLMMAAVGGSTRGRPSGGASAAETTATATIEDLAGSPVFRITVADDPENPVVASSPALAWQTLFSRIPGKISSVNGLAKYGLQEPLVVAGIRQLPGAKQAWELALPTVPFPSSTTSASAAAAPATAKKQTTAASTTEGGGAPKKERKPRAKKATAEENAAAATTGEGENTQEGATAAGKKEPRRRTRSTRDKEQKEGEAEVGKNNADDDDDDDSNMPLVPLLRSAPAAPKPKRESKPRKPSSTKVTKAQATGFQTSLDAWFEQKKNTSSGDGNNTNNNAPDDLVELFRQTPQLAASIVEGGGDSNLDSILQGLGSNQGHSYHNKNNTNKKQNLQLDPHEQNLLDRPLLDRHRAGKSREVFFNAWEKSFFNKQQQLKRNKNAVHNDDQQQQEGLFEVHEDEAPALQGICVSNVLFRTPDHSDNNTNNTSKPPVSNNNEDAAEENDNNKEQQESKQVLELKKKLEKLASTTSSSTGAPIQHQSKEAIISQQRSRFLRTMWDYTSERRKIRMLLETVENNPKMSADEKAKYLNPAVTTGGSSASGMMKAARTVVVASQQKNDTNATSSSVDNINNNNNMMMMMPSSTSSPKRAAITIVEEK